jgi:hypothetical protein
LRFAAFTGVFRFIALNKLFKIAFGETVLFESLVYVGAVIVDPEFLVQGVLAAGLLSKNMTLAFTPWA